MLSMGPDGRQRLGVVPRRRRRQARAGCARRRGRRPRASLGEPGVARPGRLPRSCSRPEAVADIIDFLAYVGFSAKAVAEGRSFMSGHLGEQVMSELVSIVDDALADFAMGTDLRLRGPAQAARRDRSTAACADAAGDRLVLGGQDRPGQHRARAAGAQRLRARCRSTWRWSPVRRRWTSSSAA